MGRDVRFALCWSMIESRVFPPVVIRFGDDRESLLRKAKGPMTLFLCSRDSVPLFKTRKGISQSDRRWTGRWPLRREVDGQRLFDRAVDVVFAGRFGEVLLHGEGAPGNVEDGRVTCKFHPRTSIQLSQRRKVSFLQRQDETRTGRSERLYF